MVDSTDEQVMDQEFINELNTQPLEHRLLLLQKFLTTAVSFCDAECGCGRAHITDKELFRIALNMLDIMARNDGKIIVSI